MHPASTAASLLCAKTGRPIFIGKQRKLTQLNSHPDRQQIQVDNGNSAVV